MKDFKTALQEILKQQEEKRKNYEQRLEKFEETLCRTMENIKE